MAAATHDWAFPQLMQLLPLERSECEQALAYADTLPSSEAPSHLEELLGNSPQAMDFIQAYNHHRLNPFADNAAPQRDVKAPLPTSDNDGEPAPPPGPPPGHSSEKGGYDAPPPGPPPGQSSSSEKRDMPPSYAPPSGPPPSSSRPMPQPQRSYRPHTNAVIEAGKLRAVDEQEMQLALQNLQYQYRIYNDDIEPEHDTDYRCNCPIHQYQFRKVRRLGVHERWARAVMYPGEKYYNDSPYNQTIFTSNPYTNNVVSPYGYGNWNPYALPRPNPGSHAMALHQTIALNNRLNQEAQMNVDAIEPKHNIWDDGDLENSMAEMNLGSKPGDYPQEKGGRLQPPSSNASTTSDASTGKSGKLSSFRKSMGIKSSAERAVARSEKEKDRGAGLRRMIEDEENGRWPDESWRSIVMIYQDKVGMTKKIADLRRRSPTQYLHLLRAGYFEPIPVEWADQPSNPLKFSIEASGGWRGITPNWRGYEDTAEERLYWVLNHREGPGGMRLKPDFISEMNMARARMARAVEPPPLYFSANDTCHLQHTSEGYSKQVLPPTFQPFDRPEQANDDTMILLDVSGSMDFDAARPIYNQYMVMGYEKTTQPKNKDVAKAIIRRFTDAMANHDHNFQGYDLTTFSSHAQFIGTVNHQNLDAMWRMIHIGGGTRVMTGWQKVKQRHFEKHSNSAIHHPVYGWQAGPDTPMLRLLLLLDGEAIDMDEFELDLLGLSWAHVTIFLIGVDGCPHHHRHANELQRISDVNHHVSFVDAQGNTPERFVTHELLKRHLGYDMSMQEFEQLEELPAYSAVA